MLTGKSIFERKERQNWAPLPEISYFAGKVNSAAGEGSVIVSLTGSGSSFICVVAELGYREVAWAQITSYSAVSVTNPRCFPSSRFMNTFCTQYICKMKAILRGLHIFIILVSFPRFFLKKKYCRMLQGG